MEISCDDELITLIDSTENLGDFQPGQVKTFTNAFAFGVSENVPDEYNIDLQTLIQDDIGEDWSSHIYLTAFAPDLYLGNATIDDGANGCLDPGESADLIVKLLNGGGAAAADIEAVLSSGDPYITIENNLFVLPQINPYSYASLTFTISAAEETPIGHVAEFMIDFTTASGLAGSGEVSLIIGQTPVLIIDLDPNSSSAPAMEDALTALGVSYEKLSSFPTSLNVYSSVFVCLGIYSNNHVLSTDEGQDLADYLNSNGSVYMEGGDTWAYDPQTAAHGMFHINGEADGTSDLGTINGQPGTFAESMSFYYSGENSWIDHISPLDSAFLVFENQDPEYGATVAFNGSNYRTIGASFEFGGLSDGSSPSTKEELMSAYLELFGVISFDVIANFMANPTQICADNYVEFTDYSTGNIDNWSWSFEGGNPSSSTQQNPEVLYSNPGTYDVQLIVSNGNVLDTILKQNYIVVFPNPGIPATPAGPDQVCTNTTLTTTYTTAGGAAAESYIWEILPEEAGVISGSGATATVTWTPSWIGLASIKVKSVSNQCGESIFCEPFEVECTICTGLEEPLISNDIQMYPNPTDGQIVMQIKQLKGNINLEVVNLLNEKVWSASKEVNPGTKFTIDLSGNPKGIYFIRLTMGDLDVIKKIVKN